MAARASGVPAADGSLYFSLNVGLVHFVVLSSMPYLGLGSSSVRDRQNAWLARDLAAASAPQARAAVPWIIVLTHVPLYCSADAADASAEAADVPAFSAAPADCASNGAGVSAAIRRDWEGLLMRAGVDLVASGHIHAYQSLYPTGPDGAVPKQSFDSPEAPVYLLTGAAGPPGVPDTFPAIPGPASRKTLSAWSYGRLTVWNATALSYTHLWNNGTVFDQWTITAPTHGPFPGLVGLPL